MKKVKCNNDVGCTPHLTTGGIYDVAEEQATGNTITYKIGTTWWGAHRFTVVKVIKIKCINTAANIGPGNACSIYNGMKFELTLGAVYDGISSGDSITGGYEIITSIHPIWRPYFQAKRFVVVDDNNLPETQRSPAIPAVDKDPDETKAWAFFTKPVADKHTCGKCNMPLPCKYHPLATSCNA